MEKICSHCGKEFSDDELPHNKVVNYRFCSKECIEDHFPDDFRDGEGSK